MATPRPLSAFCCTTLLPLLGLLAACSTSNIIAEEKEPTTTEDRDSGAPSSEDTDETTVESADPSSAEGSATEADDDTQGNTSSTEPVAPPPEPEPVCTPASAMEQDCADGMDEDCDGYEDCRDPDCEAASCGSDGTLTCTAGACLEPGGTGLPELPPIENVRVRINSSTAIVEFEPINGALDYRIYPMPAAEDVLVGENGEVVVQNAIYRCAGDRPMVTRASDPLGFAAESLTSAQTIHGYLRSEEEAILGYVYATPGPGRQAVYRLADPNGAGGYAWDYGVPPSMEYNSADYVIGTEARDALLAQGFRDDGIVFYAPDAGTRPLYRRQYEPEDWGDRVTFFYTDGPEYEAREMDTAPIVDFGERFKLLETAEPGTVPLYRVFYLATNAHDVLVAGEARYQRALLQGNQPVWSLTWPGLTATTTLVIEALDQGCPFPGGYISANAAPGDPDVDGHYPSITLDEARLESGEVYVNAQHDPANRPRPVARAFVEVTPEAPPEMDWYESFDDTASWAPLDETYEGNNGLYMRRNDNWVVDYLGCSPGNTVGPVLGQLVFGGGDYGSSCNMSITPRQLDVSIETDSFLHVRMTTEIPSTFRRYPQILITTVPVAEFGDFVEYEVPVRSRLGPMPFEEGYQAGSGTDQTLIVQPFGSTHELQIEMCDRRGWGVSQQCPRANIYGYHAGSYEDEWVEPWRPVPVMGELAGHDRPVQFDVFASTQRVYVTVDGKPAGCAVLPENAMPAGPVTIIFGSVIYHGGIDESIVPDESPHQYLKRYSLIHYDRRIDEVGIDMDATLPGWDESVLPCGTRWYGADE